MHKTTGPKSEKMAGSEMKVVTPTTMIIEVKDFTPYLIRKHGITAASIVAMGINHLGMIMIQFATPMPNTRVRVERIAGFYNADTIARTASGITVIGGEANFIAQFAVVTKIAKVMNEAFGTEDGYQVLFRMPSDARNDRPIVIDVNGTEIGLIGIDNDIVYMPRIHENNILAVTGNKIVVYVTKDGTVMNEPIKLAETKRPIAYMGRMSNVETISVTQTNGDSELYSLASIDIGAMKTDLRSITARKANDIFVGAYWTTPGNMIALFSLLPDGTAAVDTVVTHEFMFPS